MTEGSLVMTRGIANAIQLGITRTWLSAPVKRYALGADLPPMLGEQDTKTSTLYSLQPNGFVNRTVGATTDISAPSIHMSSPLDMWILICGDSFTTTASSYLPAAFTTNLAMLAHSANKIGLSATVNEFVNAQVVVLGSAQYLGRSTGLRRRQVHPSGTGEAGRAVDSLTAGTRRCRSRITATSLHPR
jgi:hypothetical protein